MNKKEHIAFYKDCLFQEYYKYAFNGRKVFILKKFLKLVSFKYFSINYSSYRMAFLIRKMQYHFQYPTKNILLNYYHKYKGISFHKKIIREYSSYIHPNCFIDKGLRIYHPLGIVIGGGAVIGKNFTIYHKTTIGTKKTVEKDLSKADFPTIGDNCKLYSNGMMIGNIKVVNNVVVGASSILMNDALKEGTYVGIPAKLNIKKELT